MKKTSKAKKLIARQLPPVINSPKGVDKIVQFIVIQFTLFFRYLLIFLSGAICAFVLCISVVGLVYVRAISHTGAIEMNTLIRLALPRKSWTISSLESPINFLLLGTDSLANRDEESKLTDTIVIVSLQPETGKIVSISFPRDLWIASESAKINSLYRKDSRFPRSQITSLTGVRLPHQIVIDLAAVAKLIDAVGGLDITVERSFVDYQFPRSDVDVRLEKNSTKLYETVAFSKGVEHMSGDRAMRYIRSRHSLDPIEGSDDARIRRQQRVIQAMLAKISDPLLLRHPEQIGAALRVFTQDVQSTLTLDDLSQIAWRFLQSKSRPQFISHQFTIGGEEAQSVLMHPERFPGGSWVYLPVDSSYQQIRALVGKWIYE